MAKGMISPIGILSFPHLFSPSAPAPGAEPRYSAVLIFDENAQKTPEYKRLTKAINECAGEAFEQDTKGIRLPIRDCADKEYNGYEDGSVFVNFWTKQRPGIVDARRDEMTVPDDVFPGQAARVSYVPFAYDVSGNKGVSLALNNIQITKRAMPRLDGRTSADQDFDSVDEDMTDNEDPLS